MLMKQLSFDTRKTALLVVDMQNGFLKPGTPIYLPGGEKIIPATKRVAEACRDAGMLVIFTQMFHHYPPRPYFFVFPDRKPNDIPYLRDGSPWAEIHEDFRPLDGYVLVRKQRYGSFTNTELEWILTAKGIETVIIAGVTTNVCCFTTATQAFERGYYVVFLSDCTATYDELRHEGTLRTIDHSFGIVAKSQEIIDRV
jgi:nicotinamidase-related amidase